MFQSSSFTKGLLTVLVLLGVYFSSESAFGASADSKEPILQSATKIFVGTPSSLALTGSGYVVDGTLRVVVPATLTVVACTPAFALQVMTKNATNRVTGKCLGFFAATTFDAIHRNVRIGQSLYEATAPWRF